MGKREVEDSMIMECVCLGNKYITSVINRNAGSSVGAHFEGNYDILLEWSIIRPIVFLFFPNIKDNSPKHV